MSENQDRDRSKTVRELEDRVIAEMSRIYGEKVIDHWRNPRNFRSIDHPDGYARTKGVCGDTMEMSVRMSDETVAECAFQTDGCASTIVCGSAATELAVGLPLVEALGAVNAAAILKVLGGLPEADVHCAQLAAETLRRAIADYLGGRHAPWKKDYRKT